MLFLRQTIQNASSLKPDKVTAAGYMLQLYLMVPFAKETLIELYRRPETEDLYAMAMKVFLNRASMATSLAKTDLFRSVRDEAFYGDLMCVRNILENNDLRYFFFFNLKSFLHLYFIATVNNGHLSLTKSSKLAEK